jgi:hypothetical protein
VYTYRMPSFEDTVRETLAGRGISADPDGQFSRIPGAENPASDDQLRYIAERTPNLDVEARAQRQWVEELTESSEAASQPSAVSWPAQSVFWIRLHGVLSDQRGDVLRAFRDLGVDPATYAPPPRSLGALLVERYRGIETVRQQFSNDELIYADYMRQVNSHPTQRGYDVRWSNANGGQVNDRRTISAIGQEYTVEELKQAILRVLRTHGYYTVAAQQFAGRVHAVIQPLVEAMRRGSPTWAADQPIKVRRT